MEHVSEMSERIGQVAQLVEHQTENLGVDSSILSLPTRTWRDIPEQELITAVRACTSAAAVIRFFGLPICGNNYNRVQERVRRLALDTSHWRRNKPYQPRPLAERFVQGAFITNRPRAKRQLLKAGILRHECYVCGMAPLWNGAGLSLILDHINGVADDWRPANLRLVCPNCNAQLPTHAGRNAKRGRKGD